MYVVDLTTAIQWSIVCSNEKIIEPCYCVEYIESAYMHQECGFPPVYICLVKLVSEITTVLEGL